MNVRALNTNTLVVTRMYNLVAIGEPGSGEPGSTVPRNHEAGVAGGANNV